MNLYTDSRDYSHFLHIMDCYIKENTHFTAFLIDIDDFHDSTSYLNNSEKVEIFHEFLHENLSAEITYIGKDEFIGISTDILMDQIVSELYLCTKKNPLKFPISFCVGIAEFPKNGNDSIEIFRLLEESIYRGKKAGKKQINFAHDNKMKVKNNYYTITQLERLSELALIRGRTESSLLREALDLLFRSYFD